MRRHSDIDERPKENNGIRQFHGGGGGGGGGGGAAPRPERKSKTKRNQWNQEVSWWRGLTWSARAKEGVREATPCRCKHDAF